MLKNKITFDLQFYYRIVAVYMYNTIEPQPSSKISVTRRDTLTRNSSSMASRPKTSSLALHITKTISNYFFKPEKLPIAM